jgi:hypothetical protein
MHALALVEHEEHTMKNDMSNSIDSGAYFFNNCLNPPQELMVPVEK